MLVKVFIGFFIEPQSVAIFICRSIAGILFMIQGYDKLFGVKVNSLISTIEPSFRKIKVPRIIIVIIAYLTSYIEFIGGILLILGLFKYVALYLLGIDLLIVSFGMSLLNPVWKLDIVGPRLALLIFVMLMPDLYDTFSLDHLFNINVVNK